MGFLASLGFSGFLNLLNTLGPLIQVAIHVAEGANPQPGSGAAKFGQVLNSVLTVAGQLPEVVSAVQKTGTAISDASHTGDIKTLTDSVGSLINVAVGVAKSANAFQKSGFVQAVEAAQARQGDTSGGA